MTIILIQKNACHLFKTYSNCPKISCHLANIIFDKIITSESKFGIEFGLLVPSFELSIMNGHTHTHIWSFYSKHALKN